MFPFRAPFLATQGRLESLVTQADAAADRITRLVGWVMALLVVLTALCFLRMGLARRKRED